VQVHLVNLPNVTAGSYTKAFMAILTPINRSGVDYLPASTIITSCQKILI